MVLFEDFQTNPDLEIVMMDATIVRSQACSYRPSEHIYKECYLADYVRSNKPEEGSGFGSIALINTQKF